MITCEVCSHCVRSCRQVVQYFLTFAGFVEGYCIINAVNSDSNVFTCRTDNIDYSVLSEWSRSYCYIEFIILVCGYVELGFNLFWIEDCTCITRISHIYGMFADNSQYICCCDEYAVTSGYIGNLNTVKIDNRSFSTCLIRVDCYLDYSTLVVLCINHFNIKVIFEHFECCST